MSSATCMRTGCPSVALVVKFRESIISGAISPAKLCAYPPSFPNWNFRWCSPPVRTSDLSNPS